MTTKSPLTPELHARLTALLPRHTWADLEERWGASQTTLQRAAKGHPVGAEMHSLIRFGLARLEAENAERASRGLGPVHVPGARRGKCQATQAHLDACEYARLLKGEFGQRPPERQRRQRPELPARQVIGVQGIGSPMDEVSAPSVMPRRGSPRRDVPAPHRTLGVRGRRSRKVQRKLDLRIWLLVVAGCLVLGAAAAAGAWAGWVLGR